MRPALFHGRIDSYRDLFVPTGKRLIQRPKSAPQWVCQRCFSRLNSTTPRSTSLLASIRLTQLHRQPVRNPLLFSPTRRNASSSSSSSPQPPPPQQPSSSSSLPSHTESLRSPLSHRFTHLMDSLQSSLFTATQHLNTLTGYTPIESLKTVITTQESHLQATRAALTTARAAYTAAINTRSASQREVNALLQRKHTWSSADLERFTSLYRSDHANEVAEQSAHDTLIKVEREAEEASGRLSESILKRYHEEQIWSDKIRRMSTWGTWGLMGVNVLLFLVFQLGLEPWRRRRLVRGFEEKVEEALSRERGRESAGSVKLGGTEVEGVGEEMRVRLPEEAELEVQELVETRREEHQVAANNKLENAVDAEVGNEVVAAVELEAQLGGEFDQAVTPRSGQMFDYKHLRDRFWDLFSDRQVSIRKWDLTALVLEGVATGMAVIGLVIVLLRPR
ncbi:MAG: hypothetical protein Q9222_003350 [Ikaeria aurantiellina]